MIGRWIAGWTMAPGPAPGLVLALSLGLALVFAAPVRAAETGTLLRAEVLRDQPFIDAAEVGKLAANDAVTIAARRAGWMQVSSADKSGWVRMLNVRLGAGSSGGGSGGLLAAASVFRTGSSASTTTTGVKGLGEADISNAQPDRAELARLDALGTTPADATAQAARNGLKPNEVAYLKPGRKK